MDDKNEETGAIDVERPASADEQMFVRYRGIAQNDPNPARGCANYLASLLMELSSSMVTNLKAGAVDWSNASEVDEVTPGVDAMLKTARQGERLQNAATRMSAIEVASKAKLLGFDTYGETSRPWGGPLSSTPRAPTPAPDGTPRSLPR